MINLILNVLQKNKALNITVLDKRMDFIYTNYIILATGTSIVHIKYIVKNIISFLKKEIKYNITSVSGRHTNWVLIDCENIVIHIMMKEIRDHYKIELI